MSNSLTTVDQTHTEISHPRRMSYWLVLVGVTLSLLTLAAQTMGANAASLSQQDDGTVPPGTVPAPTPSLILLSAKHRGHAESATSKVRFHDDDIVAYVPSTGALGLYFDGSKHGLGPVNLGDFEVLTDGSFIFTLNVPFKIPNPNGASNPLSVDDSDIVQYHPISDSFSIFLTGAELGLTKGGEDIDALALAPDGRLLISTIGSAQTQGITDTVKTRDEDLLACTITTTPKSCQRYFDGSDLKLTRGSEDVTAAWVDPATNNIYLATKGHFKAEGSASSVRGDRSVVFGCTPLSLNDTADHTDCTLFSFFDADKAIDWENQIDGLWMTYAVSPTLTLEPAVTSAALDSSEGEEVVDSADYTEAVNENDAEIDTYDFANAPEAIYLPLMQR